MDIKAIVDADSMIYASAITSDNISDAKNKLDAKINESLNNLQDLGYDIMSLVVCSGSKGNFRKLITPVYKANRKKQELPPLLDEMHQFVKDEYNSVWGFGIETDDIVARYWKELSNEVGRNNVMIVSIDKDYKQFPALIYNYHYKHKEVLDISEEEALYNFYEQMIIGDSADNVQYFSGRGKVFASKYLKDCNTKYQYTRKMLELFQEKYKGKARQKYAECYHLLKLRTQ